MPTFFGRYEQRDLLGRGGFATVYRGWDPLARRDVAIKVLSLHWADEHQEEEMRRRFLAEAQALGGLSHPNIVTLYDVGETPERPYFVMELIRGRTLDELLKEAGRLDLPRVIAIVTPLASALDLLHAAGKVHRDVKAANIMLTDAGRIVLMDLGIARDLTAVGLTTTGATLLSAESASPEQCRAQKVGPPSDIYSLGVVTYQMLSGRLPFLGDTLTLIHAHSYEPPPPLWELRPGLPGGVYAAVQEALAKNPARRPSAAGAFTAALRDAVAEPEVSPLLPAVDPAASSAVTSAETLVASGPAETLVAPAAPTPTHPQRVWSRRRVLGAGLGALALGVAGGGLALRARESSSSGSVATPSSPIEATNQKVGGAPLFELRQVTRLAGAEEAGFVDGPGSTARFGSIRGLALDRSGVLHVSDLGSQAIRRMAPDGTVTTLAGDGTYDYKDGTGRAARFTTPGGIAFDDNGDLYVADTYSLRIRKVTPAGVVTTVAGSGDIVREYRDLFGLGERIDGPATSARFLLPWFVTVLGGVIYVAEGTGDLNNHAFDHVRSVTSDGTVSTLPGQFSCRAGIVADRIGNQLWYSDTFDRVYRLPIGGTEISVPVEYRAIDEFGVFNAIAVDPNNVVYIARRDKIFRLDRDGKPEVVYRLPFRPDRWNATAMAVDGSGTLYFTVDGYDSSAKLQYIVWMARLR